MNDDVTDRNLESETNVKRGAGKRGSGEAMLIEERCMSYDMHCSYTTMVIRTPSRMSSMFSMLEHLERRSKIEPNNQSRSN